MAKKVLITCILAILIFNCFGTVVMATVEVVQNVQEETDIPQLGELEEYLEVDIQEIEPDISPIENQEDEVIYCNEEIDYEIIKIDNDQNVENNERYVQETGTYIEQAMRIVPTIGGLPVAFTHQDGWSNIGEITLVTNGAPHEQSINIDSVLTGTAIQPRSNLEYTKSFYCYN